MTEYPCTIWDCHMYLREQHDHVEKKRLSVDNRQRHLLQMHTANSDDDTDVSGVSATDFKWNFHLNRWEMHGRIGKMRKACFLLHYLQWTTGYNVLRYTESSHAPISSRPNQRSPLIIRLACSVHVGRLWDTRVQG